MEGLPQTHTVGCRYKGEDMVEGSVRGDTGHTGPRIAYFDVIAILLVVALAFVAFSKNLFIDNAVVFHDEYVYKVAADKQLDPGVVVARQLAPQVPNRLFLSVYGIGSYFGSNYYAFAQLLNVAFWSIGLLALYRVAALSGLSNARSLAFLGAAALLPLSAYTKYFMPESMFFAMFCASMYALMTGIHKKANTPVFIAGLIVGLMYFVKPHALALVIANAWFLTFIRGGIRLNILFGAGALLAIAIGKLAFPMPADGSAVGLGVYGQMLDALLAKLTTYNGQLPSLAKDFLRVAAGHALFLLTVFGLSFFVAISVLVPRFGLRDKTVDVPTGLRVTSLYLIATSVVLVGMAVTFTVLIGELGRVHSRYYFFLYPIALLVLFHFPAVRLTHAGKVLGLVIVAAGAVSMALFAQGYSEVLPVSLVSDSPEWGFVFFSRCVFFAAIATFAIAGALAVLRPEKSNLLIAVICITSALSSVDVAMKQKGIFRGAFVTGREAVAVEEIVGRDQMDRAVVVGENRDVVSKFLFYLSSAPDVEQLPAGSNLDQVAGKYLQATRVIAISEGYMYPPQFRCTSELPKVRICSIVR